MGFLVHAVGARVAARAYCGMWIADCERCRNAERLDRFQPAVMCTYCGMHIEIVWPAENLVHSIERLLLMRPLPYTQNWMPGETVADLMRENAEHGVFNPAEVLAEGNPGVNLLSVDDDGIRRDLLPVTRQREFRSIER